MGKGYYFNLETADKARRAANLFSVWVYRRYRARTNPLGMTRTMGGRYVAGVDVCGPHRVEIDNQAKKITAQVSNE